MAPEDPAAAAASVREPRSPSAPSAPGISRRGIEIIARSIYRELCARGCEGSDVIRLATALLDQLVTRQLVTRKLELLPRELPPACPVPAGEGLASDLFDLVEGREPAASRSRSSAGR